MKTEFD